MKVFRRFLVLSCMIVMAVKAGASWADSFKIHGDLRYRFESIDQETKDHVRYRNRLRARLYFSGTVTETLHVTVGLATGGSDPVSTNQTLDGSFSSKDIRFDLGYFDWRPVKPFRFLGGKMKNPFFKPGKSSMIWDDDLRPEGFAANFKTGSNPLMFFANAGYFWVEERSSDSDTMLAGLQIGTGFHSTEKQFKLTVGGGYFTYTNLKGYAPLYDDDSFGNSMDDEGNYRYDYDLVEMFLDTAIHMGKLKLGISMDYANNQDPSNENTAYRVALSMSGKVRTHKWKMGYEYRDVETDAVFGTFSDSDFAGGGTNGSGHIFKVSLGLVKGASIGATYLMNRIDPNHEDISYDRFQFDLKYKF